MCGPGGAANEITKDKQESFTTEGTEGTERRTEEK